MNRLLIALSIIALVACAEDDTFTQFKKFITKYEKKYNSVEEFLARYEVFKHNILKLESNENKSYETGVTKFSDLTHQEFVKTYLNLDYDALAFANFEPYEVKITNAAPDSYDWRNFNRVSGIKDQGSCGSCWAFSTAANLEGLYAAKKGTIKTFSEQFLVDCDTNDSGCNGGLMERTFSWIKSNGGFMYESDYPYKGTKGTCKKDKSKYVDMKVSGYQKLGKSSSTYTPVDEDEIKEFLYQTGPLAIAFNADSLDTYTSGIIDMTSTKCSPTGINHAVTLVGYGYDSKTNLNYWIVKNSWGKNWGENGYFRIARGKGTCGINRYITTATVTFS